MRKRILSAVMALAMVLSLFAMPATAEEATYPDTTPLEAADEWVEESKTSSAETETDETESLDAQEFQALLLDSGMASYTVGYMETYVFVNIGESAYKISTSGYSDYVLYETDGSIQDYGWKKYGTTYTIPAGGKIALTSTNTNGLSCAAISDFFTATKRDTPATLRKSLANGETYTYTNTGAIPYKLFTSGYSDYVLYEADGSIRDYGWKKYDTTYTVPAGSKIALTSTSTNGLSCAAVSDFFRICRIIID